MTELKIKP